ncbi:hypothetical protein MMC16_006312 [Acarospora aff. strigata]|nr:hypothetical protein [Acarospora aff. strigata]
MTPSHRVDPTIYSSPKRKRDTEEPIRHSPSPVLSTPSLKADHPTHSFSQDEGIVAGDGSPSAVVTGHFRNLNLQSTGARLDFGQRCDDEGLQKRFQLMDQEPNAWDGPEETRTLRRSPTPTEHPVSEEMELPNRPAAEGGQYIATLDIPETAQSHLEASRNRSPSPSHASKQPSRRKNYSPPPCSSPPLDHLTWRDSEITGHSPTDPLDDGYGINGIGFRPTPAIAYARAQKRTQQIVEWRNREAREARQKRSERRRGCDRGPKEEGQRIGSDQRRKVRFHEG